ncbi:inter-alpha-trypsin inhibitor heavy chain H3-like [Scomber scombrus]|uniref:Inter-alpha-trypsin inhibitor heavy chain H3-like n=1 Tax=Scomber scombrus TaxID=13677 RepID=A0AAV1QAA4_SCOSC
MQSEPSTSKTLRPDGVVRLCPSCSRGYIMGFDLHPRCEACLGAEHARLALTPRATCAFCARLPAAELRRRADGYLFQVLDGEGDGSWGDRATFSVEKAMVILDQPDGRREPMVGHETAGSAPSIRGSPPGSPLSLLGDLESEIDVVDDDEQGAPLGRQSPSSLQPAGHFPAKALLQDLPSIIRMAADLKNVPMPEEPPAPVRGILGGDIYDLEPSRRQPPLWPQVSELRSFVDMAYAEPGKLKAPVSRYDPFTRVQGITEGSFPSVPPLEENLATILLPKATFFGRRKPTPPSPRDQVTARLTDRAHQCAAQTAAAANNIALLSSAVSTLVTQPGSFPPDVASDIGKAMAAILALSTATTVAQARIMAWLIMLQRNMWLHMSELPVQIRHELLDGPISSVGLFGPLLQSATTHLQTACEEGDKVNLTTT